MENPHLASIVLELPAAVKDYCPHLSDKMLVDLVNGLDVSAQKIRYQGTRTKFLQRVWDALDGQGAERQREINANLQKGLEASLAWLCDLTAHQARSDLAIAAVGRMVGVVAEEATKLKVRVENLERVQRQHQEQLRELRDGLNEINLWRKADAELRELCNLARIGYFRKLPPMAQILLVCDRLFWGDFGNYIRAYPGLAEKRCSGGLLEIQSAADKIFQDAGCGVGAPTRAALASTAEPDADLDDAILYLADWTDSAMSPFAWTSARYRENFMPLKKLPNFVSPTMVAGRMFEEVFGREIPSYATLIGKECIA